MHPTNLRNLFHLHRLQALGLAVFLAIFLGNDVLGQGKFYRRTHLEDYDDKSVHYGFLFAVPFTRYSFVQSEASLNDSTSAIHSPTAAAFRMGFTLNAYLTKRFDIRTTPSISLYSRELKYESTAITRTRQRESTWIEVPLLVKYKSARRRNTRMYLLGGASFGFETNVKNKRKNDVEQLNTRGIDVTVDYGVGFERFFEFFKLAPELRFSHGLVNLVDNLGENSIPGVTRMTTNTVTLYLNFE